jgi:hypothetical protein
MAFAEHTKVPFSKTVQDILALLRKAGASQVGQYEEDKRLTIMFGMADRYVRFRVGWEDSERSQRQRGRALLLVIKAKLESVESGVETFEQAFLANVVMSDGQTVYERVSSDMQLEYDSGKPAMYLITRPRGQD